MSGACGDANETGSVGPKQPAITTTALSGPVTIGGNIYDVAHLTGTAPIPMAAMPMGPSPSAVRPERRHVFHGAGVPRPTRFP